MSEASELGESHCCCTGDCPHDSVHDCLSALTEHIKELTADYKRVEAAARAVIVSDGRYGWVPDSEIEALKESFETQQDKR